jgi:hypothetical protein
VEALHLAFRPAGPQLRGCGGPEPQALPPTLS